MSKNDELNAALLQDEAQWREIVEEVDTRYPEEAAKLKALFVSRKQSMQKAQDREAEGLPLSALALFLKTWFLQRNINKIIREIAARE